MRSKLKHDHKRDLDKKHKWALGEAADTTGRSKRQPAKLPRSAFTRMTRREVEFNRSKASHAERMVRKYDKVSANDPSVSETSTEEDIQEASAAPEPDVGIAYSYDAACGPNQGGQILSMALAKAVEKYEVQATEKLIMEEYEVVGRDKEDTCAGYTADDGDFELI
ncbi:MAG: hypothetical protein Q9220_000973 [cf. Caloplaca sp. 1 TL-2023]